MNPFWSKEKNIRRRKPSWCFSESDNSISEYIHDISASDTFFFSASVRWSEENRKREIMEFRIETSKSDAQPEHRITIRIQTGREPLWLSENRKWKGVCVEEGSFRVGNFYEVTHIIKVPYHDREWLRDISSLESVDPFVRNGIIDTTCKSITCVCRDGKNLRHTLW